MPLAPLDRGFCGPSFGGVAVAVRPGRPVAGIGDPTDLAEFFDGSEPRELLALPARRRRRPAAAPREKAAQRLFDSGGVFEPDGMAYAIQDDKLRRRETR